MNKSLFTSAIFGMAATTSVAAVQEKPNILFICIDDLRTELGVYGSQDAITPNLDRLACESRLFNNQFVQAPTSGASRAMMLTGIGAKSSADVRNSTFSERLVGTKEVAYPETFIHHLKRNGYHTVGMGKVSHADNGFKYIDGKKMMDLPFSWDEFINNPNSPWADQFDARLHGYDNGKTREKGKVNPAFEFKNLPDSAYADGELANLALSQLDKLAEKDNDKPFFMAVGFYKPHLPFTAPKKYWDMYENVDISISPNPGLPESVDKAFLHNSNECFNQYNHSERGGAGVVLSEKYAKEMRRAYFSALTYTDTQVGKVLAKLHETGLDKNTIIVVWGDHGWHLGDQTIWGKHSLFERALNSTFMVKTPNMKKRGVASNQLIAAVDIYPTICDLTEIEIPEGLDGKSFAKELNSPKAKGRDYVVSYWNNSISVRDERYRFTVLCTKEKKAFVLFDHLNDPWESKNIAESNPKLIEYYMNIVKKENRDLLPI